MRRRCFIRSLLNQLLSEQIKKRADSNTGTHKPLQEKLQNLRAKNKATTDNNTIQESPQTTNKRKRYSECY